jgi:hypothetical protein
MQICISNFHRSKLILFQGYAQLDRDMNLKLNFSSKIENFGVNIKQENILCNLKTLMMGKVEYPISFVIPMQEQQHFPKLMGDT